MLYGYSDSASDEAFSRMFERDKNELRDLGIPLETGRVSEFDPAEGYRMVPRDAYALSPLTRPPTTPLLLRWPPSCGSRGVDHATQGALLKLRAAGVSHVDAGDAGIAITSTAGMPGIRGSEESASESRRPPSTPGRSCSSRTGQRAASRTRCGRSNHGVRAGPTGDAGTSSVTMAPATPPGRSGCPGSAPR